jgi:hypothetical protein
MKIKARRRRVDGIWGDFGRWIGRGGFAEGLRSAPVRPAQPTPVAIGVVVGGFCARVVAVVLSTLGEGR